MSAIALKTLKPDETQPKDRVIAPVTSAEFGDHFLPISESYPPTQPSSYVARRTGETLSDVALAVWGDASLWYILAEANGLNAQTLLKEGQTLVIPNVVSNVHKTARTFKPYNPGEIIGNTSPTLPEAPPPPEPDKCKNFIVAIVAIVVTVVLTVYLGPLGAGIMGPVMAAAVGGMAGSVAGQLTGMALGVQDEFDWGAVAAAGLSGAVTGAIGGLNWSGTLGQIGKAVVSNMAAQAINIGLDQQETFSWESVAVAGAMSYVGPQVNEGAGLPAAGLTQASQLTGANLARALGAELVKGAVRVGLTELAYKVQGDADEYKPDWVSVAADSLGTVIGTAIGLQAGYDYRQARMQEEQARVRAQQAQAQQRAKVQREMENAGVPHQTTADGKGVEAAGLAPRLGIVDLVGDNGQPNEEKLKLLGQDPFAFETTQRDDGSVTLTYRLRDEALAIHQSANGEVSIAVQGALTAEERQRLVELQSQWQRMTQAAPEPQPPQSSPILNRVVGGLQVIGGAFEWVGAGILTLAPDPTLLTKAGAVVLGVHGADTLSTGFRTLWTGEIQSTLTQQAATVAAEGLGADPQTAKYIGMGADFIVGVGPAFISTTAKTGAILGTSKVAQTLDDSGKVVDDVVVSNSLANRTVESSLEKVAQIRQTFNVGTKRNIAFAEFEINGKVGELVSISGNATRTGTVVSPAARRFETIATGNNPRALDAEVKIFENLASQIKPGATGTIHLFSELPLCVSCAGVVPQFKQAFPGLKVIVTSGPGR